MTYLIDKQKCCGCGACSHVCPKQCIILVPDEEGFLYPKADESACINCGLCGQVCPFDAKDEFAMKEEPDVYASYSKNDKVRFQSSSGGIFTELAEEVIRKSGVVFGAAFDDNFSVHHICVSSEQELVKLRGSKYLQSRIENSFIVAKEHLEKGNTVLFSGTGCQIAGLKGLLQKEYENLLTVDVVCHGTPSPLIWEKYLSELRDNYHSDVKAVSFRDKKTGWKTYSIEISFRDGKVLEQDYRDNPYMKLFLGDICLRPSCYNCKYKPMDSRADITLGDCWGIEHYMPEMDDDKGTSIILSHTEKGKRALDGIRNNAEIREADLAKIEQPMIRHSAFLNPKRELFFKQFNEGKSINQLERFVSPAKRELIFKALRKLTGKN